MLSAFLVERMEVNAMKTIMQIATEKHINKVCINGDLKDIRQLDKTPFDVIPEHYEVMKDSIFNEPMLFCY